MKHFQNNLFIALAIIFFSACGAKGDGRTVIVETTAGDIVMELYPDKAPLTVAAFVKNVKDGAYNPSSFYRVLKSNDDGSPVNPGLIQGGIHLTGKTGFPLIPHESTEQTGLTHTSGTVSMARLEPGTASTEFFICIGDQSPLDAGRRGTADSLGMAAFAKVVKGMDVVKKIQSKPSEGERFLQPIDIQRIRIN